MMVQVQVKRLKQERLVRNKWRRLKTLIPTLAKIHRQIREGAFLQAVFSFLSSFFISYILYNFFFLSVCVHYILKF